VIVLRRAVQIAGRFGLSTEKNIHQTTAERTQQYAPIVAIG
jgi:hypothetical protein